MKKSKVKAKIVAGEIARNGNMLVTFEVPSVALVKIGDKWDLTIPIDPIYCGRQS